MRKLDSQATIVEHRARTMKRAWASDKGFG